jgi:hypothetical protein
MDGVFLKKSAEMSIKMTNIMGILYGMGIPKGEGLKNKLLGFICMQRPAIAVMGPLMFFAASALAIGRIPSWEALFFGSIAVYLLTAAEHSIDDTIDTLTKNRRIICHITCSHWDYNVVSSFQLAGSGGGIYRFRIGYSLSFSPR